MLNADYDGLAPQGCEPPAPPNPDVEPLLGDFERIALGVEVAWNTSSAICVLQNPHIWKTSPITAAERDCLLRAFALTRPHILGLFPGAARRSFEDTCLDAVAGLLILWAETPAERAARHPHVRLDLHDHARHLRNACHNLCLREDIDRRQAERVGETVSGLLRRAVG